jgi:hypothetical protein
MQMRPPASAVILSAYIATTIAAQHPPRDLLRRFTVEQWDRFRPLFTLVEAASAGRIAPDARLQWQNHVLRAEARIDFAPFTIKVPPGSFTSFPLAMYVRVVPRGAVAKAPGPRDALAQYPFEDVALFGEPNDGRISRAFAAPPGQWDVYVALGEPLVLDQVHVARTIVLKEQVNLPDFSSDLATSSVIVAEKIEADAGNRRPDFEDQLDDPYRLWGMRITPSLDTSFDRQKALALAFLVYNTAVADDDKPDVEIRYRFVRHNSADAVFGEAPPQIFNARTLRSDFSLSKGDLLVGTQTVPLRQFPTGDYSLQIAVTDNAARKQLVREVAFVVR